MIFTTISNSFHGIVISASRLFIKVLVWSKSFPDPDQFKHSLIVSFVIHGTALSVLHLFTYALWFSIAVCGNVAHQFLFKLTQWPMSSGIVLPAIQKFPITVGIVLVSMTLGSCGALSLICSVLVYFILISKMYEDYLEEFVFKTAKLIAEKLFGRKPQGSENENTDQQQRAIGTVASSDSTVSNGPNQATQQVTSQNDEIPAENSPLIGNDAIQETNVSDEPETTSTVENETANDNDTGNQEVGVDENTTDKITTIAQADNSFEVLYNQLDPSDRVDINEPRSELSEEKQKELAAAEAGNLTKLMKNMESN